MAWQLRGRPALRLSNGFGRVESPMGLLIDQRIGIKLRLAGSLFYVDETIRPRRNLIRVDSKSDSHETSQLRSPHQTHLLGKTWEKLFTQQGVILRDVLKISVELKTHISFELLHSSKKHVVPLIHTLGKWCGREAFSKSPVTARTAR